MSEKKYSFVKTSYRVMSIQLKAAAGYTFISCVLSIIHALAWVYSVIVSKNLFDAAAAASTGQIGFTQCLVPLLILACVTFGQQIINGVSNFFWYFLDGKAGGKIRTLLHLKLTRINPACFEDTTFLDDLNKAKEGIKIVPIYCTAILGVIFFYGVYFISIGVYFFYLKPILLITLLLSFLPALLGQIVRAKVFTKLEQESAPLRRENEYYRKALCDREYFKETRTLGAFGFFYRMFSDTLRLLMEKSWRAERKTALLELLLGTSTFAGMAVSAYLLFTAVISGEISVGTFAAVFAALKDVFAIMKEIITGHIGAINRDIGKLVNFIRLLDMPERKGANEKPDFSKGVAAETISFTYPGREERAVKDVSLTIADNETIAIVGENGAGKSTLVRLLTGLYCPSQGRVIAGGRDTAQTSPAALYAGMSGVFQKFQRYKMTLKENVILSDTETAPVDSGIVSVLKEAGMEIEPGLDLETMLSPEFDGIDLSGGQWQRLAIGRGLYRRSGFIVLDEPTAAIDPIEETRIYRQFQRLAKGKCAVVVTHRLGSAKLANRIIVMDNGKIVDTGTHEELLSRPGKYADMWKAQAQWYEREEC